MICRTLVAANHAEAYAVKMNRIPEVITASSADDTVTYDTAVFGVGIRAHLYGSLIVW